VFRTTDIVLIAVMVAGAAFTYKAKSDSEHQLSAMRKLESQIRLEEETIDLLKADWSLLTQPYRLQRLAEAYKAELNLQPVEAMQIAGPEDIPMKLVEPEADGSAPPLGTVAGNAVDKKTITGSTAR